MVCVLSELEDYNISLITGFLPETPPLQCLPPYFDPWEAIANDVSQLVLSDRIRDSVNKMPLLSHEQLHSEHEHFRAALVLGVIAQAYVWAGGDQDVVESLPACVSVPWCAISSKLGIPPIITHSCVVLYNWSLFNPKRGIVAGNIRILQTICGGIDEAWFYLITVAIEAFGGKALAAMLDIQKAMKLDEISLIEENISILAECLVQMTETLEQMHLKLDSHIFYTRVRPFLAGWKHSLALPNGIIYEGVSSEPKFFSGASAAQSSLIQAFDVILNVEHHPTKSPENDASSQTIKSGNNSESFLREMRNYMPRKHRQFLNDLEKCPSLREYVLSRPQSKNLQEAYNDCISKLTLFRNKHINMVTKYIVMAAHKINSKSSLSARGTGGTDLIPFLKHARNETENQKLK